MNTVWILWAARGEYDDWYEWVVSVHRTEEGAKAAEQRYPKETLMDYFQANYANYQRQVHELLRSGWNGRAIRAELDKTRKSLNVRNYSLKNNHFNTRISSETLSD